MDAGGEYRPPSDCSATAANLPVQPLTVQQQDKKDAAGPQPQQQPAGLVGTSTGDACMQTCPAPAESQPTAHRPSHSNGGLSPEMCMQSSDMRGGAPSCSTGDVFPGSLQTKYPCITGPCSSSANTSPIVHSMHGSLPIGQTLTSRHSAPPHILQCPTPHQHSGMPYPGVCMPELQTPYCQTGWQECMPPSHGAAGAGWPHVRCMPYPEHPGTFAANLRLGQQSPAMTPGMLPMDGMLGKKPRRASGHYGKGYGPMPQAFNAAQPNVNSGASMHAAGLQRRSTVGGLQSCPSAPLGWNAHSMAGCSQPGMPTQHLPSPYTDGGLAPAGFPAAGVYHASNNFNQGLSVAQELWELYNADKRPVPLPKIIVADITKDICEDHKALQALKRNGSMGPGHGSLAPAVRQESLPMKDQVARQALCRAGSSPVTSAAFPAAPSAGTQQPVPGCAPPAPALHGNAPATAPAAMSHKRPSSGVPQDNPAVLPACKRASMSDGLLSHPLSPQATSSPCTTSSAPEVPMAQPPQVPLPALPPRPPHPPHSASPNLLAGAVAIVRQSPGDPKRKRDSIMSDVAQGALSLSGRLSDGRVSEGACAMVCEMPTSLPSVASDVPIRVTDISMVSARAVPADELKCLYGDWADGVCEELIFDSVPDAFYTPFGNASLDLSSAGFQAMPAGHAVAMVSTSVDDIMEDAHNGKKVKMESCV